MHAFRTSLSLLVLPFVVLLTVAGASGTAAQEPADAPAATAAVQVTQNPDPARAHASPQIARNPVTGELVVGETEVRTRKTCNVHISTDDGRSWFPGGDPMVEPWTDCSGDPDANVNFWLEFDRDGVLYMAFPGNDPAEQAVHRTERQRHIFLARSEDSGRTFETTTVWEAPEHGELDGGGNRNGRTWVAVDPNDPRYVYVTWMNWWDEGDETRNRAMIAASSDGGETFAEPVSLGEEGQSWYEARPVVDRDGTVHVLFPSRQYSAPEGEDAIRSAYHRASTDRGATWSPQRMVDEGGVGTGFARKWGLKTDRNTGALYVVWYGNEDPLAEAPGDDRDILFRASTDAGETWTEPTRVNDDIPGVPNFHPGMAVAPNGRIDVAWLDFRNSPDPEDRAGLQDVYYSSSDDQGATWSDDLRVTDRSIDRSVGVWSNNADIHAPVGITSTDEAVYMVWQDSRNAVGAGQAEDVYFASVRYAEPAAASTAAGLPGWTLGGAGFALGLGVAIVLALAVARKRQAAPGG